MDSELKEALSSIKTQVNNNFTNLSISIKELKDDNREILNKYIDQAVKVGEMRTQLNINTKSIDKLSGMVWKLSLMAAAGGSLAGAVVTVFTK